MLAMNIDGTPESFVGQYYTTIYGTFMIFQVSKGAEVVMLSKKVFLKYINETVRNNLRESIRAYPREQKLQENFQNKLDWEDYKSSLVDTVLYSPCGSFQSPIPI